MKHTAKTFWAVVILMMMNNTMAAETLETVHDDGLWFSSSSNAFLNLSSTAMATNHLKRGIRLAHQAMQAKLNLSDHLIANYNLCLGYLGSGDNETAKPYCTLTNDLAKQPFKISKVRGAYYLTEHTVNENSQYTNQLLGVVIDNMNRHNTHIQLSLF